MTKSTLFSCLLVLGWALIVSSSKDPNNPPTARTGAPSETTCAASGCHNGGSFVGIVSITGVPDTIQLNTSYTITLTHKSNAKRSGFQLTCLDGNNAKFGTLTTGSGTSVANQASLSRQYVRQSAAKTISTVDSTASWSFTWKSPTTAPATNTAKFYFSSLAANADNGKTGDNVLLGTHTVHYAAPVSAVNDLTVAIGIKIYPTVMTDALHIDLESANEGTVQVYGLNGNLVLNANLGSLGNTLMVDQLPVGSYVINVIAGGKTLVKRVVKM
jgi:hypothetical protein